MNIISNNIETIQQKHFRVLRVICRQVPNDWTIQPAPMTTDIYKGIYNLKFPCDWDGDDVYCDVESVFMTGMEHFNADGPPPVGAHTIYGTQIDRQQMPRSWSIRSDDLARNSQNLESKRFRGQIKGVNSTLPLAFPVGYVGAKSIPYSDVNFYGITNAIPDTEPDKEEIPVNSSNILLNFPNDRLLNYEADKTAIRGGGFSAPGNQGTAKSYKQMFNRKVSFLSLGNKVSVTNFQTTFDLYISANYDIPRGPQEFNFMELNSQNPLDASANNIQVGLFEPKLRVVDIAGFSNFLVDYSAGFNQMDFSGWTIQLVFYQPINNI